MIVSEKRAGPGLALLDAHLQLRKRKAARRNARPGTRIFVAATGTIPFSPGNFCALTPRGFFALKKISSCLMQTTVVLPYVCVKTWI